MSLLNAAERFASIDRSTVVLEPDRCLRTQDQYSACAACQDVCPAEAIQFGKPPVLDTETCQLCLACLPACPTGAIQADDGVAPLLNCATRLETTTIELVCEKHTSPETGTADSGAVRIRGCLAGLGSGTYLMLAALGIEKVIVRTDACASCEWRGLKAKVIRQISQARQLLGVWGREDHIVCAFEVENPVERPLWEASNPPLSRRDLFRMAAQQGQVAMARAMENKATHSEKLAGRDRRRLLGALEHLPGMRSAQPMSLKNFGFANLSISETCTACGACAHACPTQALRYEQAEDDSSFTLTFSVRDCIGCDVCEHVCAPGAITIDHAPLFEQVFGTAEAVTVRTDQLVRCARCHTLTARRDGTDLCAVCEYRRANPFGSMLPPGMKIPERLAKKKRVP